MFKWLVLLIAIGLCGAAETAAGGTVCEPANDVPRDGDPKICLFMIVKNEKHVIERALASTLPLISKWHIADTGSDDGTQDIIRSFFAKHNVPGTLYEDEWVDFATNRNLVLQRVLEDRSSCDFALTLDSDEEFKLEPDFALPCNMDKDYYYIVTHLNNIKYDRVQLIATRISDWKYRGVVHEALDTTTRSLSSARLAGIYNLVRQEGSRSRDPDKYKKDAKLLEKEHKRDPGNARTVFYLAQSWKDAREPTKALKYYQKRANMSGFPEETFYAKYQVGLLQRELNFPKETLIQSFNHAHTARPARWEPLFHLGLVHMESGEHELAYWIYKNAYALSDTQDVLFVDDWQRTRGIPFNLAVCAHKTGRFEESSTLVLDVLKFRP